MKKLLNTNAAYIAAFLDADGSLIAQFKKNKTNALGFQFQLTVQFTQDKRNIHVLQRFKDDTGIHTTIRERPSKKKSLPVSKDDIRRCHEEKIICDFVITAAEQVRELLIALKPYVRIKAGQLNCVLRIIELIPRMRTSFSVFSEICSLTDQVSAANYSKSTRKNTGSLVLQHVISQKFFDKLGPVETSINRVDIQINGANIYDLEDFDGEN